MYKIISSKRHTFPWVSSVQEISLDRCHLFRPFLQTRPISLGHFPTQVPNLQAISLDRSHLFMLFPQKSPKSLDHFSRQVLSLYSIYIDKSYLLGPISSEHFPICVPSPHSTFLDGYGLLRSCPIQFVYLQGALRVNLQTYKLLDGAYIFGGL